MNTFIMNMKRILIQLTAAALLVAGTTTALQAQLNPMGAIYYQNQYLVNPAMAGSDRGLNLNLGYRSQWNGMPGAPTIQALTAEYGVTDKMGLGVNLYSDKAGLLRRTRVEGTYAYHLPLAEDGQKLSFGISFGFQNERVDNLDFRADPNDVTLNRFNSDETYLDGTFGLAYKGNKLTLQGAVPNMKALFIDDDRTAVDYATFFTAASYRLDIGDGNGVSLEPKLCYRGIKGYDNILDAGTSIGFINNSLNLMAMYHSTKSATFGMGMNYRQSLSVMGIYTTSTAALSNYTSGSYEISVRLKLPNGFKGKAQ